MKSQKHNSYSKKKQFLHYLIGHRSRSRKKDWQMQPPQCKPVIDSISIEKMEFDVNFN